MDTIMDGPTSCDMCIAVSSESDEPNDKFRSMPHSHGLRVNPIRFSSAWTFIIESSMPLRKDLILKSDSLSFSVHIAA